MTQPVPVGGGRFEVDMSRAPEAIRELESARSELEAIRDEVAGLGRIVPPTRDQVTIDAAQVLSARAVGGPNSMIDAVASGIDEINRLIDALRAGFAEYERGDDDIGAALRRAP
ncbi:hypothetical protein [Actinomycetospora aeridis]|uniref:PE family protein n=1 Tax=Actinomycetospora aeridis TaxID=3129231 RepID=A0ABU8N8R6_9PSEU